LENGSTIEGDELPLGVCRFSEITHSAGATLLLFNLLTQLIAPKMTNSKQNYLKSHTFITPMEVVVTGGAGFIGGHLAERFTRYGYDVIALDQMHPYYDLGIKRQTIETCERVAAESDGSYEFIKGDIRDDELVNQLIKSADYVYHQAGRAGVRDSVAEPRVYNEVNVGGTLNILDAAREWGIERIVMASSSSVYGGRAEYLPFR
jgi:UDP-glucose 4-epimerase